MSKTKKKGSRRRIRWGRVIAALIGVPLGFLAVAGASIGLTELLGWKWTVVSWSTVLWFFMWVGTMRGKSRDGYNSSLPSKEESISLYGVEPYDNEVRGWIFFAERVVPYVLGTILAVWASCATYNHYGWEVSATWAYASVSLGAYLQYRQYWKWQHRPTSYDPSNGILTEWETENYWLALLGSSPQRSELEKRDLDTPKRSVIDKAVGTQTLRAVTDSGKPMVLRHLKHFQKIDAIYLMRKGIPTEQMLQTRRLADALSPKTQGDSEDEPTIRIPTIVHNNESGHES